MHALELNALCRRYGDLYAVNQLDLSVPAGSIYGFLGPNGAGKTTTLRMITGLLRPTSGEIRINGLPVSFGLATGRERIGYLPDVPTFYPWMTPQEYLRFSGSLYGIPHRDLERRIAESLDLVGLQKAKRRIGGYSRGMKQRLGIAQALLHTPSLVLLDEPASALDPIGRKDVMDIIRNLAGTTTVFFSTHILSDIERVCDLSLIHISEPTSGYAIAWPFWTRGVLSWKTALPHSSKRWLPTHGGSAWRRRCRQRVLRTCCKPSNGWLEPSIGKTASSRFPYRIFIKVH